VTALHLQLSRGRSIDKSLELKTINKRNFGMYGVILEHVNLAEGYEPLIKVNSGGWIWAILTFRNRSLKRLERHPTSKESFEPVSGTSVIALASPGAPDNVELFLLDKPVVLNEGVWHDVMSLSDVSTVKITENNDVTDEYRDLGYSIITALVCK